MLFRCPVRILFVTFFSFLSPNRGQKTLFYSDKQAFNLSGYMIAHPEDIPCLMLAHQQRKLFLITMSWEIKLIDNR